MPRRLVLSKHVTLVGLVLLISAGGANGQHRDLCDDPLQYPKQCAARAAAREAEAIATARDIFAVRIGDQVATKVYRYRGGDVMVLYNQYDPGQFEIRDDQQKRTIIKQEIRKLIEKRLGEGKTSRTAQIVGHTDLLKPSGQSYEIDGICKKQGLLPSSDRCLGNVRAVVVARMFSEVAEQIDSAPWTLDVTYDSDALMRNTNRKLEGTLFAVLGIKESVRTLEVQLGIPVSQESGSVRSDVHIQKKIAERVDHYKRTFAPFRSVVVILQD